MDDSIRSRAIAAIPPTYDRLHSHTVVVGDMATGHAGDAGIAGADRSVRMQESEEDRSPITPSLVIALSFVVLLIVVICIAGAG